jgi:hypothetical protein
VIASPEGCTVYLLGDFERLLPPAPTADAALEAFEEWSASNTFTDLLVPSADSAPAAVEPDPGP